MNLHHHSETGRRGDVRVPARRDRRRGEAGYIVVLGALMMVGLLLITALVVDFGAVYAHRRNDQNGADAGATAAAQNLAPKATESPTAVAIRFVEENIGEHLGAAAWNSCTADAGRLAVPATGANCISFDGSHTRIRVRLPDRYYATSFASAAGIRRIRHSAFAIAGVTGAGFGGVLPFGMPLGAGGTDGYACIKTNSGGLFDPPCSGPDTGNFGTIDLTYFGNESKGTTQSCGSGAARTARIPNNIALGVDHDLATYTTGDVINIDTAACAALTPGPNGAQVETGNLSDAVGSGLLDGSAFTDGGPARLQRSAPELFDGVGNRRRSVRGHDVDDNGLWQFIPADLTGNVPSSCHRDQFVDSSGNPTLANLPSNVAAHLAGQPVQDRMIALLARCFAHYAGNSWDGGGSAGRPALIPPEAPSGCSGPCSGPVFSLNSSTADAHDLWDIQYTPRFAYVPELVGAFPSGSSDAVKFRSFRAVYIQRLVMGSGQGAIRYDPGIASDPLDPSGNGVREITVWVFPPGMLPGDLQVPQAPYAIGVNRFVQLLR